MEFQYKILSFREHPVMQGLTDYPGQVKMPPGKNATRTGGFYDIPVQYDKCNQSPGL